MNLLPPPHRRTVEEAIAQANAKERIRNARGVRAAGGAIFVGGLGLLARPSSWSPYHQILGVHIHGGPSFTLSLSASVGILAVIIGPILYAAGRVLVRRAIDAAERDPVTAPILNSPIQ
jgi:hypothetical protein